MITWSDLTLRYRGEAGTPTVLSFGDTTVPDGGMLLLRGPSGSGKSTLLGLLTGWLQPTSGQVRVNARVVSALSPSEADAWRGATVGFMPQRLHLSAHLCVTTNLAMPFLCAGLPVNTDRITHLAEQLGLSALLTRHPASLSAGQAQRVALARALVREPGVLVADEPTASLDDRHAQDVMDLILKATAQTSTHLVVATHDQRLIDAVHQVLDRPWVEVMLELPP